MKSTKTPSKCEPTLGIYMNLPEKYLLADSNAIVFFCSVVVFRGNFLGSLAGRTNLIGK